MLNIMLVNVPTHCAKKPYDEAFTFSKTINFGLLSVATYLKEKGLSVAIFDQISCNASDDLNKLFCLVEKNKPQAIGLSCISGFSYPPLKRMVRFIKDRFHEMNIIVGGKDHIGVMPEIVLNDCREIDIVISGEAEIVLHKVLMSLLNKSPLFKIPNIAYRQNNDIIKTSRDDSLTLPKIPFLEYRLYPNILSFPPCVEVSRGCPFSCKFCVSAKSRVRKKPVEDIIKEIKIINEIYGTVQPKLYFETPVFLFSSEEIEKIIRMKIEEGLNFTWRTETRVEYLEKHGIERLAAAGLRVVDLGLESASPEILVRMGKTNNPEHYLNSASKILKTAYENGVIIKINLLFYAGESRKSLSETIMFLECNKPYITAISAYPLIIYPGINSKRDLEAEIDKLGGSLIQNEEWNERHLTPVNPSADFNYSDLQNIGTLIGKTYQSIHTFYEQKCYVYFSPGITYSTFEEQAVQYGIERLPFYRSKDEAEKANKVLMTMLKT